MEAEPTHIVFQGSEIVTLSRRMQWIMVEVAEEIYARRDDPDKKIAGRSHFTLMGRPLVYHPGYDRFWRLPAENPAGIRIKDTRLIRQR